MFPFITKRNFTGELKNKSGSGFNWIRIRPIYVNWFKSTESYVIILSDFTVCEYDVFSKLYKISMTKLKEDESAYPNFSYCGTVRLCTDVEEKRVKWKSDKWAELIKVDTFESKKDGSLIDLYTIVWLEPEFRDMTEALKENAIWWPKWCLWKKEKFLGRLRSGIKVTKRWNYSPKQSLHWMKVMSITLPREWIQTV
jgi:hypothetical protein